MDEVQSATDLFGKYRLVPMKKKQTERGELLKYFSQKTEMPIARVAYEVAKMTMDDLYFLKSICDAYEKEKKGAWSKAFWGSRKVIHRVKVA